MDFALSEELEMLRTMARDFAAEKIAPFADKWDEEHYFPYEEVVKPMGELGFFGTVIPEEYGGMGDFLDLAVILQEMGRVCFISPYFATLVLGASAILKAGTADQKKGYLPEIAAGKTVVTLALLDESARYSADSIRMPASEEKTGFVLNGTKLFVPHAHSADYIIVAARTRNTSDPEHGITLFLVDGRTPGVSYELLQTIDGDKQCRVQFNNARISRENILGEQEKGWHYLKELIAQAAIGRCLETVGACDRVMELTMNYAKERTAFGNPIGSFQSIQHRSADMLVDLESSRYITYKAAWSISTGVSSLKESSIAKAWVNQAARRIVASAHQIHGAIGFTEDHILHMYTKRIRTNEFSFGDTEHHLNKIAV